jgi:hypothetical protein
MTGVRVDITRFVDDGQPGWVECKLVDTQGHAHYFIEKVPVVSLEDLEASSSYPRVGLIACEVIERKFVDGREIAIINTERPWAIESVEGHADFGVFSDLLVDPVI